MKKIKRLNTVDHFIQLDQTDKRNMGVLVSKINELVTRCEELETKLEQQSKPHY